MPAPNRCGEGLGQHKQSQEGDRVGAHHQPQGGEGLFPRTDQSDTEGEVGHGEIGDDRGQHARPPGDECSPQDDDGKQGGGCDPPESDGEAERARHRHPGSCRVEQVTASRSKQELGNSGQNSRTRRANEVGNFQGGRDNARNECSGYDTRLEVKSRLREERPDHASEECPRGGECPGDENAERAKAHHSEAREHGGRDEENNQHQGDRPIHPDSPKHHANTSPGKPGE